MSTPLVLARTARAEWTRIWTVRSSWSFAAATAIAVSGIATILAIQTENSTTPPPADASAWEGARSIAMFALFGILAMAAVLSTGDHATGAILSTLQWTPRRGLLLIARSVVIVAATTAVGVLLYITASVLIRTLVPAVGLSFKDGAENVGDLTFVFGLTALISVGIGLLLRNTASALVSVIALVLVLPLVLGNLPYQWALDIADAMPGSAAIQLVLGEDRSDAMTTTSARLLLTYWALGALIAGGWRLLRSDVHR